MSHRQLPHDPEADHVGFVQAQKEEHMEIHGYQRCLWKRAIYVAFSVMTLGFMMLVSKWKPRWHVSMTCSPCSLSKADLIVIKADHDRLSVVQAVLLPVKGFVPTYLRYCKPSSRGLVSQEHYLRFFVHQHVRYVWNTEEECFLRLRGLDHGVGCLDLLSEYTGYLEKERQDRAFLYGPNTMDIQVPSYAALLVDEILNPFYVFQIASIALWISDQYYYYAFCILVISCTSVTISLYETRKQRRLLRDMVTHRSDATVSIIRRTADSDRTEVVDVHSSCLVPGDIICVPPMGCTMTCDAVLTAGNCLVNESMLTGESVPEYKTPLLHHDEEFSPEHHKRHVLFSGTEVIQTRYFGGSRVTAVVIRTGFSTAKGELVRSILFPQPLGFKFYKDAMKFLLVLFAVASLGMTYTLYIYTERQVSVRETIVRALDIVTIVVPPALPAAMTVGTVYAQARLKRKGIFCISPARINVGGKLKLICFDKTGTLTEEGLDLWGVLPVHNGLFTPPLSDPTQLNVRSPFLAAMASCHTLTTVHGKLVGDPVDLSMFLATKWALEDPSQDGHHYDVLTPLVVRPPTQLHRAGTALHKSSFHLVPPAPYPSAQILPEDSVHGESTPTAMPAGTESCLRLDEIPYEVGIVRQFPFSSSLQRMSVVCRTLGFRNMDIYVKGAPETIYSLCDLNTVPDNFHGVLRGYTLQGFRVMALAYRPLSRKLTWHLVQRISRDQLECDLRFLGLLILQNMLKPESTPAIHTLHGARIRCLMVTGDNLLTAISVARGCDMVSGTTQVIVLKASVNDSANTVVVDSEPAEHCAGIRGHDGCVGGTQQVNCLLEMEAIQDFTFALDGRSFSIIRSNFPELYEKLLVRGTVFARMLPGQKRQLVEDLRDLGYVVSMCGDGANDCGALRAADVGISLSEAESSVAAPFTSKISNIQCVPIVVREGRCALVTAFQTFKFVTLYSLIQFLSVLLLYSVQTNLSDPMFLYVDLFVITTLAVTISHTEAYPFLVPAQPSSSLVSVANLTSVGLQLIIVILGQAGMLACLQAQPWYIPIHHNPNDDVYDYWDTAIVFFVSCYQYLIMAVVFSTGAPFQRPFWTNRWFLGNLILLFGSTTFLLFSCLPIINTFFQMIVWRLYEKIQLRLTLLLVCCLSLVVSYIAEVYVAQSTALKRLHRAVFAKRTSNKKYKIVDREVGSEGGWTTERKFVLHTEPTSRA